MKKILLLAVLVVPMLVSAQITSFPYYEDFESGAGGWTSATLVGGDSWNLGTPNGTVINQAAPGGVNSWYLDELNTGVNEQSHVISPVFDFTNVPNPMIELDIWWDLVYDSDGAVFQSSIDGGNSWQNVGHHEDDPAFAPNWFNHGFLSQGFPNGGAGSQNVSHWTGDGNLGSLGWVTAGHILTGLGGESSVMLRMAWINKTNNLNHPANRMAFDNIHVYDAPALDFSITDVQQAGPCGGGFPGQALISVTNLGAGPGTVTEFHDGLGTTFPISSTTIPGQTSVDILVDLPLQDPGSVNMDIVITDPGDSNPGNDVFNVTFNCNVITGLNHCNDFENAGIAPWFVDPEGANSSWGLGGNAGNNTINTPFSGSNFWGTTGPGGGYNPDEQSSIVSPFFDFSNLENSGVSFQLWHDLEVFYDGAVFQFSLDGGANWSNVGTQGSGTNWFNEGFVDGGGSGGQNTANWNGSSGGWVNATNSTPGLDGQNNVIFRLALGADDIFQDAGLGLDDFCITGTEVTAVDTPDLVINEISVFGSNEATIEVYNISSSSQADLTNVLVSVDDGTTSSQFPLSGSLAPLWYKLEVVSSPSGAIENNSYQLFWNNVLLDEVCFGDAGTLNAIGLSCSENNVDYEFDLSFSCSYSRIPNGTDTDNNTADFSTVAETLGAENQDQSCLTVGLEENEELDISLFPNPAMDLITIKCSQSGSQILQVIDVFGKTVSDYKIFGSTDLDLTMLSSGLYSARLTDESGNTITKRFVKK